MRDVREVLREKEETLRVAKIDVFALKRVLPMLAEEGDPIDPVPAVHARDLEEEILEAPHFEGGQ